MSEQDPDRGRLKVIAVVGGVFGLFLAWKSFLRLGLSAGDTLLACAGIGAGIGLFLASWKIVRQ